MNLDFVPFLQQLSANPLLMVATLLTLGVILVNGWTDAPNAIASCVMGGTSMAGGLASIGGTVIGVFVISLLQEGIMAMRMTKEVQMIITGLKECIG